MFSGLPDMAALMPTLSDVVLPSKVVMSTTKLERLGTWCTTGKQFDSDHLLCCSRLFYVRSRRQEVTVFTSFYVIFCAEK